MSSTDKYDSEARTTYSSGTSEQDHDRPLTICTVCQQPIEEGARSDWRGEPVHFECGAELRGGESIDENGNN